MGYGAPEIFPTDYGLPPTAKKIVTFRPKTVTFRPKTFNIVHWFSLKIDGIVFLELEKSDENLDATLPPYDVDYGLYGVLTWRRIMDDGL